LKAGAVRTALATSRLVKGVFILALSLRRATRVRSSRVALVRKDLAHAAGIDAGRAGC